MNPIEYIMLIDDDEDDRDIFLSVIQESHPSIRCEIAINGQDALNKLAPLEVLPQLIFLDLNMPLMNGSQFLLEMRRREHLRNVPVVILSTSSDKNTQSEMKALGAMHFITKPDRFSEWELALMACLNEYQHNIYGGSTT